MREFKLLISNGWRNVGGFIGYTTDNTSPT